jgi:RNA polymerase sigma-70 factor (ECF subfamily)
VSSGEIVPFEEEPFVARQELEPPAGLGNLALVSYSNESMVSAGTSTDLAGSPRYAEAEELVAASRDGDKEAFEQLVKLTYKDAYGLALRLTGNEDDAQDIVQDAYLRAYRNIKKFRGESQFSTWMYRIVANCASTELGKRKKHSHEWIDDEKTQIADDRPEVDPHTMFAANNLRQRTNEALQKLPPKLRAVVVLRDVYDMPHEAIAEELGISESTAKVRLHRARKKLKDELFPKQPSEPES